MTKIARLFTDREPELALFAKMVRHEIPGKRVLAIEAPGGHGKTWLLDRYEAQCKDEEIPCVRFDFDASREGEPLSPELILEKASEVLGLMPANDLETFARLFKEMTGGPASVDVGSGAVITGGARFGDIGNIIIKELHISAPDVDAKARRRQTTRRFREALTACGGTTASAVWLVDTCEKAADNPDTTDWLSGAILSHVACDEKMPLVVVLAGRSLPLLHPDWEDCVEHITLGPFDERQAHILVCERIGLDVPAATVKFVHGVCGGVPQSMVLMVEQYLRAQGVTP